MHIFSLIANSVKEEARYKANLLGAVLALLTLNSLQFIFFDVLSSLVGSDRVDANWLLLFFMSYAVGGLAVSFFCSSITEFYRQLTLGRVDSLLVRPISLLVLILFRWGQFHFLLVAVLLIMICVISNKIDFHPFALSPVNTGLYLATLIAGVVASITFMLGLSSFSFITQRDLPVDYIHTSIFTFALFPDSFYSRSLSNILVAVLPMIMFASVALDALYNGLTWFVALFLIVVSATFFGVLKLVYSLFKRFDSIGG